MTLQSPGINLESNLHRCMALLEKLLVLTKLNLPKFNRSHFLSSLTVRSGLCLPKLFYQIRKLILRFSSLERNTINVLIHNSECILFQGRSFSNTATL